MSKNKKNILWHTTALTALLAASPVLADNATVPMGATQGATIHSQNIQPDAGPSPYELKLQYTGEAWDNVEGGLKRQSLYMQNLDAQLSVDTGKAFGWTGGRAFVEGFYQNSRSADTQLVGPAQDPSAIDSGGTTLVRLYQAYYDQTLGNTDLLFGLYDPETEFGVTKPMALFFNGGYAWTFTLDQSGFDGPSNYPNTALAFRARQKINDQWSVQGVISDGAADNPKNPVANDIIISPKYGALFIGEVDYTPVKHTKIMAGYWGYTGKFDTQNEFNNDGSTHQVWGSDGGYIGGATRLYTQEGLRGLDAFANIGLADSTVNATDRTLNAGLTYTGFLDARPHDKVGVAFSTAWASDPYRKAQAAAGNSTYNEETNFELTYRATINSWLTVQPDIQYWVHPNYDPTLKNDLLVGVHFEIGHLFNL